MEEDISSSQASSAQGSGELPPCSNVCRLGKKTAGRARPVRVTLPSRADVLNILRNKKNYSGPLSIREDLTLKQRNHLRDMKEELKNLIDSGTTNKTLRYIGGVPLFENCFVVVSTLVEM